MHIQPHTLAQLPPDTALLLFDGVCNFCDGAVRFFLDRDPHRRLVFASLQSDLGQQILRETGMDTEQLGSLVLVEPDGSVYLKSEGALRAGGKLAGVWSALSRVARWVPRLVRDGVYDFIARNRYRWFGRMDACRLPTPDERTRFVGG